MRIICVSSHHDIVPNPESKQGVLLTYDMLMNGIWSGGKTGGSYGDHELKDGVELRRSKNEQEYHSALKGLAEVEPPQAATYVAVVSLRWCSMLNCLVLPHRVWLKVFSGETAVASYSHKGERHDALGTFLDTFDNPVLDKSVWRTRFKQDITTYWETLLSEADQRQKAGVDDYLRAKVGLGHIAA